MSFIISNICIKGSAVRFTFANKYDVLLEKNGLLTGSILHKSSHFVCVCMELTGFYDKNIFQHAVERCL